MPGELIINGVGYLPVPNVAGWMMVAFAAGGGVVAAILRIVDHFHTKDGK